MINWAIIGSGDVVNRLVNDSFNVKNISKVKYIYSKDKKSSLNLKKRLKIDKIAKNLNEIINDSEINGVYIATPPNSHYYYIKFFSKKIKNIICEKPISINLKQLNEIKSILKKNRNNFYIPFYRRHHERFLFVKKMLGKKFLGQPIFFRYTLCHGLNNHPTAPINKKNIKNKIIPWRFNKKISGGGNYIDMGVHALDMTRFLLGNISKIDIESSNLKKIYDVEETLISNIKLKNNILGQAIWSSIVDEKIDKYEIFMTHGKIEFSLNFSDKIIIKKGKKTNYKKIKMTLPVHKKFIHSVINSIYKKKSFIDYNGLKITELQIKSLNK